MVNTLSSEHQHKTAARPDVAFPEIIIEAKVECFFAIDRVAVVQDVRNAEDGVAEIGDQIFKSVEMIFGFRGNCQGLVLPVDFKDGNPTDIANFIAVGTERDPDSLKLAFGDEGWGLFAGRYFIAGVGFCFNEPTGTGVDGGETRDVQGFSIAIADGSLFAGTGEICGLEIESAIVDAHLLAIH